MRYILSLTLSILCLSACKQEVLKEDNTQKILDSAITTHLEMMFDNSYQDALKKHDKVLFSYYKKDTSYLLQYLEDIDYRKTHKAYSDSITRIELKMPIELFKLDAAEAYRFTYKKSFSPYAVFLTITKRKKDYNLEVYIIKQMTNKPAGVSPFDVDTTYKIAMTEDNWLNIKKGLEYADFWGMKYNNNRHGLDGSGFFVHGMKENYNRRGKSLNKIGRWSPEQMAIFKPYLTTLKLAKLEKQLYLQFAGGTISHR